jgi:hypothetical protein
VFSMCTHGNGEVLDLGKKTYLLLDQIRKLKYKGNIIALMIFILEMVYTKPRFF